MIELKEPNPIGDRAAVTWWPWGIWIAAQLAALGVAAGRIPLSAAPPSPQFALGGMWCAQFLAAAIFFPGVTRGLTPTIVAALSAFPFLQLAGLFDAASLRTELLLWCALICWLAALALIAASVRQGRTERLAAALVAIAALGPAACDYLAIEWGGGPAHWAASGNLLRAAVDLSQRADGGGPAMLAPFAALLLFSLVIWITATLVRRHREKVIHKPPTF